MLEQVSSARQPATGRLEAICEGFESAWRRRERPAIESLLPDSADLRHKALVELVHMELELRLELGEAARAEEYLARFPELAADRLESVALVAAEFKHRLRREPNLTASEIIERFPQLSPDLELRLNVPPSRHRSQALRFKCPHCRNLMAVVADLFGEELYCASCGSSFHLERDETSASTKRLPQLGKFKLLETVGHGACGTVYRAKDMELDRIVAVKVPRSGSFVTKEDEDRFVREGRSVAQLHHPGIVPVYEVGRSGVFPYMASEFVEGRTLANAIASRRFGFRDAAEIIAQAADALHHAHGLGVVHRDVKPSNLMIVVHKRTAADWQGPKGSGADARPRFTVRVMDFGLARRDEGEVTLTADGQVLGTPAYMSPEQARGEAHGVSGRSDIYSLGVILYQLLTNELPFRGNRTMLVHQVLNEEPRPPRSLDDRIPRDLEIITLKCLQKFSARRYAAAEDLALDLRRFLRGEPIMARPSARVGRAWRWIRRNAALSVASLAAAMLAVALVVFMLAFFKEKRAREEAEQAIQNQSAEARVSKLKLDSVERVIFESEMAFSDSTEAIRLKSDFAKASIDRAVGDEGQENLDKLIDDSSEVIRLKPDFAEAYHIRGYAYWRNGDNDRAIADYTTALRLKPNQTNWYTDRGDVYTSKGDFDKDSWNRTETNFFSQKIAAILCIFGYVPAFKGEYDKAIADYTEALRFDRDNAELHFRRGYVYARRGRIERVQADSALVNWLGFVGFKTTH